MAIELVTGYAGHAHVTAEQDGRRNVGTFGQGRYVLASGQQFSITVDSANQVTIGTGDGVMDGRHVCSETPTQLAVESGTQGQKRHDLVCVRYSKDPSTGTESAQLVVVRGTPAAGTPSDPAVGTSSIADGAATSDWPLYRLPLDGISLGTPVPLFDLLVPISSIRDMVSQRDPVVLFDNESAAASATTTLSQSSAGFRRLTIFYRDTDGAHGSVDVWSPNGKTVGLGIMWVSETARTPASYNRFRWVRISGSTISTVGSREAGHNYRTGQQALGSGSADVSTDRIAITQVLGWRV